MNINTSYLKENDVIVVATSGGPDSMFLLNYLKNDSRNFKLICAHVNHKMRPESDMEYLEVKKYCEKNKIIFEGYEILEYHSDNFHNEARVIRYDFFKSLVKKYHAKYLATAHHGDDLMETILMRIARGSNLSGYAGFKEIVKKDGYICIRPLIHLTKDEIKAYMDQHKLWYAIDNSNAEDHYTRNRYRHHVLPFLKTEDKNIHEKYLKYSEELLKNNDFIDRQVESMSKKAYVNNKIIINEYLILEEFVERRLISKLLHTIYGDDLFLISDIHIDLIDKLIKSKKTNGVVNLPNNYLGVKSYNSFEIIVNKEEVINNNNYEYNDYLLIGDYEFSKVDNINDKSNFVIRLDSSELTLPLYFRYRHDGDKMKIKNLSGSKKIKDILIDSKVPTNQRDLIPILVDSKDQIIWVPGIKKSQFDKDKKDFCDIIIKCERKEKDEKEKLI